MRFEEHEGELFRMLEEPVPLTDDAELPVLVRLIQDDTMLGKANKRSCHPDTLAQKIICSSSNLTDDGLFMDGNYTYCYEIIGTLVEEGTKEWALYQMAQSEKVCHEKSPSIMYCESDYGIMRKEMKYNYVECYMSVPAWLNRVYENGWQLYKEPKPLLAEAKVGDLCQRRDGKWMQIDEIDAEFSSLPPAYRCGAGWWTEKGASVHNQTLDIVHTEPLAPEGTKEWAWQMMLLGKIIIHSEYRHENATWKMNNGTARSCLAGMSACSKEQWVANAIDNGWQLYTKPKEEPQPTKEPIADCENCKHLCTNSNIDHCHMYEPCDAPNPESATQTPLPVSDATQLKVGDWVEWCGDQYMVESAPPQSGGRYNIRSPYDELGCSVCPENITRKLSPSEVVIRIGCLSGTVRPVSTNGIHVWFHLIGVDDRIIATIRISSLDAHTRELVEGLLESQEEEK